MRSQLATLESLSWSETPAEVFAGLRHLEDAVFLDTAGNLPHEANAPFSLIAANASELVTGSLHNENDVTGFGERLADESLSTPDDGLPHGGWIGTVDYDGRFRFGLYRNLLLHLGKSDQWVEVGGAKLSKERREPSAVASPTFGEWQSNFSPKDFQERVARAQEYIAAGDIYQVNLAQRFEADMQGGDLWDLYEKLRHGSPGPMAAYLKTPDREILSSSPELFLRMSGSRIETRPIKGTRPRFANPEADIRASHELQTSEKERAELLMITDLLRNDLGQVCEFGSIQVEALARLESLAQVHHLVSTVTGTLRENVSHLEAVTRCFPGGSITGAPKKRAMEIISELETVPRGLYTGAIGYFGLNGESQFNIAIRTLIREGRKAHYHVGSGVVADSIPQLEYEETLHKARGLQEAIASASLA